MQLNPKHLTLHSLLQGRLFRIPNYQRAYAWGKKQRADLFEDIREIKRSGQDHFMATVVTLAKEKREVFAEEFQVVDIVDGQQRLTTLIILLKSIERLLDDKSRTHAKIKSEIDALLVKGDEHSLVLLQTNHDSSDYFVDYLREGVITRDDIFVSSDKNIVDAQKECEAFVASWARDSDVVELLAIVRNRLSMIYHELDDEASVYRIFEVLNSRGLDVKWIDKFKSQIMSLVFFYAETGSCAESLKEMHVIWQDIYRLLGLRDILGDDALRFAGTLKSKARPNRVLTQEDASSVLTKEAGNTLKTIVAAARWLKKVVIAICALDGNMRLNAVTEVQHSRFVAVSIVTKSLAPSSEKRLLKQWEKVSFRIFSLWGADSRHASGEFVRLAYDIANTDIEENTIVQRLNKIADGFDLVEKLNDKAYWNYWYYGKEEDLRYLLYRYEEYLCKEAGQKINADQWNKIWALSPSASIEHISPQSQDLEFVHHLGNLTMLPPGINSSLKDKKPKEKSSTYHTCGLRETMMVGETIHAHGWNKALVIERAANIQKFAIEEWS